MELGAGVAKALLASAESLEVLDSLGDYIVEKLKVDAAGALWDNVVNIRSLTRCWTANWSSPLMLSSPPAALRPLASTLSWGPVQVTSKKTLTTILAFVEWKDLIGDRVERVWLMRDGLKVAVSGVERDFRNMLLKKWGG